MIANKLFASKCFSIILDDWIELKFNENMKETTLEISEHVVTPQPGITRSYATTTIVNSMIKRALLPENGTVGDLQKGIKLIDLCTYISLFFLRSI
jgi:hypothetical protein